MHQPTHLGQARPVYRGRVRVGSSMERPKVDPPCPLSMVRAPSVVWIVAKGALRGLQERGLVVFDLEQILPTLLDDVRAQRSLRKQGVTGHQHIVEVNLAQQRQRL